MSTTTNEKSFAKFPATFSLPHLIEIQLDSYKWFMAGGLRELFEEISPIKDWSGKELELYLTDYYFDEPKYDEAKAKFLNLSYEAPLRVKVKLVNKRTGQSKEQEAYFGEFPLMTQRGTFVVNGVERVVVSQLIRSAGIFFTADNFRGRKLFGAKLIPNRGAWLEFETDQDGAIFVKIDRKRKIPATSLFRIFGLEDDQKILNLFKDVDTDSEKKHIEATLAKDQTKTKADAFVEVYKRLRPGDLATVDNAQQLVEEMFFSFKSYDIARVGRWKLN